EGCNKAVTEVFCRMHEKGWIYKGSRIINWCPVCNTSISDAEVSYEEQKAHLWHIKYPLVEEDGTPSKTEFLTFATTRPETMLGDTAVAVNPKDERDTHLHGRSVYLPIVGKVIPIVLDDYVDMEFGTGVVKITPAHDPNDFEVGKRHNLPEVNILNDDATINANGGKYQGLPSKEARKQIVQELDSLGLLEKIEDYTHNVGTHDRCHTVIEPMIKEQWFMKMDELIKPAIKAVQTGEIKLVPERMSKIYFNWTDNIRDWCISRQLWWGHRIPAYTCDECGKIIVARSKPETCPHCGKNHFTQDPDTLDTWFSSALWPFSTLGWPEETEDLKYFYPTDVLVTGYDIIFFWVIRMVFSGYEQMGERPFKTVLFHGLIRDALGRKMSKSLGNGIDPLEMIEKYGADALRFTLMTGNAPGNDMRFSTERIEASRNFANKLWNASRFILMNCNNYLEETGVSEKELSSIGITDVSEHPEPVDKWILSKSNTLVMEMTDLLERFELGIAVSKVYDFLWDEFCDWYIEMVKPRLYNTDDKESKKAAIVTLRTVLFTALKLLHPYMPFITEEIFTTLQEEEESIMVSSWPIYKEELVFEKEEREIGRIKDAVKGIRNVRSEMNVAPSKKIEAIVVSEEEEVRQTFITGALFFKSLAGASELKVQKDKTEVPENALSIVTGDATIFLPLEELVDIQAERERLSKEEARLLGEIKRSNGMLGNEKFLAKAPEAKVREEKEKLEKYQGMLAQVRERIAKL
ncbi:MAG: valine--tRNA ligase, partial [Lachnospiraceae bacterium]|nr:valine--tRNA ligase [Lachnospiraceae bacterium]